MPPFSESDHPARFLKALRESIDQEILIKLVLGKYRGKEPDLQRILVRPLVVKGVSSLSFTSVYPTREVVKNVPVSKGIERIQELLGDAFKSAHLFSTTENLQLEFSKKGKVRWGRSEATHQAAASSSHNREKERLLDLDQPFLTSLGITDADHRLIPSMSRKWKQINRFLEIFHHAVSSSRLAETDRIRVVDFGSGKGYLTFAVHELLRTSLNVEPDVVGIELREALVRFCNESVSALGLEGLLFRQGDVHSYVPETIDIMMALHACDTATDQALYLGITAGAEIILCSPCCHKEIRPQLKSPDVLEPILRFGVHLGQEAEMVTDSLRALLLEANGYQVQLLEFVSLEHTSKNKMLLAVKHDRRFDRDAVWQKIAALKAFYGIREQCLESLLRPPSLPE